MSLKRFSVMDERMRRPYFWLAAWICLLTGCSNLPSRVDDERPLMDAAEMAHYYDYPHRPIQATVHEKEANGSWTHELIEFEFQLPPELNDQSVQRARERAATADPRRRADLSLEYTVRLDYYRPRTEGKHPLVILSPILGGNNIFIEDFARYFAAHGFCAAVVHRKRANVNPADGLEQVERYLRKSVIRVREALDWCLEQPGVDPARVASFGISYGAIINTMVAGAEPRIQYHVFALGGGDLPDIILSSKEPQLRRDVAEVGRARGWTGPQLREELERTLRSDPLNSAPLLKPANVLMVVAQYDNVVGTRYENLLWKEIGKPRRIIVPLGHYTTAIALPFIRGVTLRFLNERFGIESKESPPTEFELHSSKRY